MNINIDNFDISQLNPKIINSMFYLNNYLESKEDPKWWIKQSDYNPETMFKEEDYTNYKSICNI